MIWPVLRRRLLPLLVVVAMVVAIAYAVATRSPVSYTAGATLVVPTSAAGGEPQQANQLAANDAVLVGADPAIADAVARRVGQDADAVGRRLTASATGDDPILELAYEADTRDAAVAGIRAAADAVTGGASSTIPRGSVAVLRIDTEAAASGRGTATAIVIGVVLGLALAGVLLIAWERTDPRVDDGDGLEQVTGCPVSILDARSEKEAFAAVAARMDAIDRAPRPTIALVPAVPGDAAAAEALATRLNASGALRTGDHAFRAVPAPGPATGGEFEAQRTTSAILVVTPGVSVHQVASASRILERFGADPAWAILARGRGWNRRQPDG